MTDTYPGNRPVERHEVVTLALLILVMVVTTGAATWSAGLLGVPHGWRLAAGACVGVLAVGVARLAWLRRPPTWRWVGAVIALWALIVLVNWTADVRFW